MVNDAKYLIPQSWLTPRNVAKGLAHEHFKKQTTAFKKKITQMIEASSDSRGKNQRVSPLEMAINGCGFQCPNCYKLIHKQSNAKNHVLACFKGDIGDTPYWFLTNTTEKSFQPFVCFISCDKCYATTDQLKQHLAQKHTEEEVQMFGLTHAECLGKSPKITMPNMDFDRRKRGHPRSRRDTADIEQSVVESQLADEDNTYQEIDTSKSIICVIQDTAGNPEIKDKFDQLQGMTLVTVLRTEDQETPQQPQTTAGEHSLLAGRSIKKGLNSVITPQEVQVLQVQNAVLDEPVSEWITPTPTVADPQNATDTTAYDRLDPVFKTIYHLSHKVPDKFSLADPFSLELPNDAWAVIPIHKEWGPQRGTHYMQEYFNTLQFIGTPNQGRQQCAPEACQFWRQETNGEVLLFLATKIVDGSFGLLGLAKRNIAMARQVLSDLYDILNKFSKYGISTDNIDATRIYVKPKAVGFIITLTTLGSAFTMKINGDIECFTMGKKQTFMHFQNQLANLSLLWVLADVNETALFSSNQQFDEDNLPSRFCYTANSRQAKFAKWTESRNCVGSIVWNMDDTRKTITFEKCLLELHKSVANCRFYLALDIAMGFIHSHIEHVPPTSFEMQKIGAQLISSNRMGTFSETLSLQHLAQKNEGTTTRGKEAHQDMDEVVSQIK